MTAVLVPVSASGDPQLESFEFWRANAGWWRSENTYFDRELGYNIRSYYSVVHVEVDGRRYRETEYKTYSPGGMATRMGGGVLGPGEGVEADAGGTRVVTRIDSQ